MKAILKLVFIVVTISVSSNNIFAQMWHYLGKPGFSAGAAQHVSLAVDNNDVNYVAYTDGANGDKATVKKYDGKNWIDIGTPGFSPGAAYATHLALDNSGNLHVAFQDQSNGNKATVMKYDGTNWAPVGGFGISPGATHKTTIAFDSSGNLFLAYCDSANVGKATVMKHDGASWTTVGMAGFSPGPVSELLIAINSAGTPYVIFTDLSAGNPGIVMLYNGISWTTVGSNSPFSGTGIDIANIAFGVNDTPYIAYHYSFPTSQSYVKKLINNRWEWVYVFGPNTVSRLAMDSISIPYIVCKDTAGKLCVEKSGGGNWSTPWQKIGKPGFSPGKADFVTMVINNMNVPIVAYQDEAQGNKMSVMAFDCFPEEKLDICAIILDTVANNRVAVIWDPASIAEFADSFCIYREDSGIYTKLATLPLATYRFIDASANPDLRSYRYKVTYINKCGIEAPAGPGSVHRTIKLDFMYRSDEFASLKWNRYEGIHDPIYTIMRSNNGGPFLPIAKFKINGNDTTYMDNYQPAGQNRYRIDIELDNACVYYTTYYRKITSNMVTSWNTGITEIAGNNNIVIAPNPVYNELRIISGATIAKVEITDIMGKTLITESGAGRTELVIDVSNLPPDIYSLRVNSVHNKSFVKH